MVKSRKGFTLIELLVVITIIAVLAAILFPVFMMARAKARAMACMQNLKQFGTMFKMYQGDWDGRYPYTALPPNVYYTTGGPCSGMNTSSIFFNSYDELWTVKLEPYVKYQLIRSGRSQGIMRCKDSDRAWKVTKTAKGSGDEAGYGYNFLYLGLPFKTFVDSPKPADDASYNPYRANPMQFMMGAPKESTIAQPGDTVCLVDNAFIWAFPPCYATVNAGNPKVGSPWYKNGNQYIRPRHQGRTNVLWCDGHVTSLETKYLVTQGTPYGDMTINVEIGAAKNNELWDLR